MNAEKYTSGWRYILSRMILITIGSLIGAFAVSLFLMPSNIAAGGITGAAIILRRLTGIPVGVTVILGNIPILILGFIMLKGWKTLAMTVYASALYSALLVVLPQLLPQDGITNDIILDALFGGVLGGAGTGVVFRAGGTVGGSSTLVRIVRKKSGVSLSTATLFTDTAVLIAAGIVFGWTTALYAALSLFLSRSASDYVLENAGAHSHAALIVTDSAAEVRRAVADQMGRDVTSWSAEGTRLDEEHRVLLISLGRSEISGLRKLVRSIDPGAFMTVLKGQATYGKGFTPFSPHMPFALDEIDDDSMKRKRRG